MKKFFVIFFLLICSSPSFAVTPGYNPETGEIILPSEVELYENKSQNDLSEIQAAEARYKALQEAAEETANIRLWEKLDKEMKPRRYDELVFEMRKNFDEAKAATNPFIGEQGYVIYPYGEVIPIITCRPMRMTDVALEPGESIMGIHAGDSVRWMFAPSQSMKNGLAVSHIVVKPSEPGISTNLLIHTDKRSYNLDFTATESSQYIRGLAFSYQTNDLTSIFLKSQQDNSKKSLEDELQLGIDSVNLDSLYTRYTIVDKNKVDWKPDAVFDDGNKTYIRMPKRFSETPAFYVYLDKKETLSNFRVKGRYYIVDRLFNRAYLKIGNKRVAQINDILSTLPLSNIDIADSKGYLEAITYYDNNTQSIKAKTYRYGFDKLHLICKRDNKKEKYCYKIDTNFFTKGKIKNVDMFSKIWHKEHPKRIIKFLIKFSHDDGDAFVIFHHEKKE